MKRALAMAAASPHSFESMRDLIAYLEYAVPDVEAINADSARWLSLAIAELHEAAGARPLPAREHAPHEGREH